MNIYKYGLINLSRRRRKAVFIILITAITTFMLVVSLLSYIAATHSVSTATEQLGADIVLLPQNTDKETRDFLFSGSPVMGFMDQSILDQLHHPNIERVSPQFFLRTLTQYGCCSFDQSYRVLGIDVTSDFVVRPFLEKQQIVLEQRQVVLGSNVMPDSSDEIEIMAQAFTVMDRLKPTGTSLDDAIILSIEDSRWLAKTFFDKDAGDYFLVKEPKQMISSVMIQLKQNDQVEETVKDLKKQYLNAKIISVDSQSQQQKQNLGHLSRLIGFFCLGVLMMAMLSMVSVFQMMAQQRQNEVAYLFGMGFSKKQILISFVIEIGMILGIGIISGLIVSVMFNASIFGLLRDLVMMPNTSLSIENQLVTMFWGGAMMLCLGFVCASVSFVTVWKASSTQQLIEGGLR